MAKDCLEALENPLESTGEIQGLNDRREEEIVFHTNQIVHYLESAIDKFQEGTDTSFECSKIEENLQSLNKGIDANWKKNRESQYQKILHTAFGTKRILSEICFGVSINKEDNLTQQGTNKFQSHLLKIKNNSNKLKLLSENFAA
ncbi:MAG: hypothetical protein AB4062_08560 [Crocosphaera sp.]